MFKFVTKALSPLFGKKGGAKKGKKKGRAKKLAKAGGRKAPSAAVGGTREMTPEREKLLEEAMAMQRAKADVFKDLSATEKKKLHALAVKTLLRPGRGKNGG